MINLAVQLVKSWLGVKTRKNKKKEEDIGEPVMLRCAQHDRHDGLCREHGRHPQGDASTPIV